MQGLWKEKISGWNHKGNKRKKQTRKHLLKDKVKPLVRKFFYKNIDTDFIYNEANKFKVIEPEPIYKNGGWVETWKIKVVNYIHSEYDHKCDHYISIYSESVREAFLWKNDWYDDYSFEPINGSEIIPLSFLYKEEVEYDIPLKSTIKNNRYSNPDFNRRVFIYGKPIEEDFFNIYGFYSTKGRKYAQKMVNKAERGYVKNFIKNSDWDKEIKTHSLSKSIAWEIW